MNDRYRLSGDDLLATLKDWDAGLKQKCLVVACGGTALTLQGYKESTIDVDLLVPIPKDYEALISLLESLGYNLATGNGWKHPNVPWIFDLFRGQTIFQTELLDPIQEKANHRVIVDGYAIFG